MTLQIRCRPPALIGLRHRLRVLRLLLVSLGWALLHLSGITPWRWRGGGRWGGGRTGRCIAAHAVGVLEGPCEKLHEAYAWIHSTWLPTSGREVAGGACYEVYLNDARSVVPEEIRTAIHVPLR